MPDDADAHYNLGAAYGLKGQYDLAKKQFEETLRLYPNYADAQKALYRLYKLGETQAPSASTAQPSIPTEADNFSEAQRHLELGNSYRSEQKYDSAISEFQEAVRLKPDYAEAHYNLGMAYGVVGKKDWAITQYKEALRLKPDYQRAHFSLAVEYSMGGQRSEEHTSELQSQSNLVCRLLLEKKK